MVRVSLFGVRSGLEVECILKYNNIFSSLLVGPCTFGLHYVDQREIKYLYNIFNLKDTHCCSLILLLVFYRGHQP